MAFANFSTGISAFVAAISRDSVPSCTNEKAYHYGPFPSFIVSHK